MDFLCCGGAGGAIEQVGLEPSQHRCGKWVFVMELVPGFSLFRGLYEFAEYSFAGNYMGMDVASRGSGIRKHPLFFLKPFRKKCSPYFGRLSLEREGSKVFVDVEKPDVSKEREVVKQLLKDSNTSHAIICNSLKKIYPGKDGNPAKYAVRGLSLALNRGECFGAWSQWFREDCLHQYVIFHLRFLMKATWLQMMGLMSLTSVHAYIEGLDLRTDMDRIYTCMGMCPQHDMLWETLTGREHLLLFGRLRTSKAVEKSLKSLNLYNGGVGDKLTAQYSGGIKRRLSVAISLIGDPQVVYMDEPRTGLDPVSRNNL
ncbi:hypothetical protein AMTR_s00078p00138290 [Amborella trichopoda]|uniref:ABC transporter domain-containing protein n=1 Tax=Amborella trichopoda TaxID=13333 RepID=W1P1W6_AMBTC|nr:hypothetical protein AMTR_s00078p00138290 [Amborella trichopoda]